MSSDECIAARGSWGTVEWAIDLRGRLPAKVFFDSLTGLDKAKILTVFNYVAEHRVLPNPEKFKKVKGTNLFEFKCHQLRFLGDFRRGNRFVVAHGYRKQRDRLDPQAIRSAQAVLTESDQPRKEKKS